MRDYLEILESSRRGQRSHCRVQYSFVDPEAGNRANFDDLLSFATMIAPKLTIQGGTTEVLRGIIARGLGLR